MPSPFHSLLPRAYHCQACQTTPLGTPHCHHLTPAINGQRVLTLTDPLGISVNP